MLKRLILFAALTFSFAGLTCKDTPPGPPPPSGLDTTSHEFVWQTEIFGGASSSGFHGVAVINDTTIWAVGKVSVYDSAGGVDPNIFNAALWNGTGWTLKRITVQFMGGAITPPLEGTYGFSSSQIWMISTLPTYGDGIAWTQYNVRSFLDPNLSVSKAWGANPDDMYFVGPLGSIAHYTNGTWSKITSGVGIEFFDVYGALSANDGQPYVYCVASDLFDPDARRVVRISGAKVDSLPVPPGLDLYTVWTEPHGELYIGGSGLWKYNNGSWAQQPLIPGAVVISVRGNSANDIFAVGTFGLMNHFNGKSWYKYEGVTAATLGSVSIKGNTVAAVGSMNGRAVALVGKRR